MGYHIQNKAIFYLLTREYKSPHEVLVYENMGKKGFVLNANFTELAEAAGFTLAKGSLGFCKTS